MERSLLLQAVLAWVVRGSKDVGCDHIMGTSGQSYRWALQNPQLVAPVLLDYDVLEYKSPLMASLTDTALIVSAAADMTANFNLTSSSSAGSASSAPQKYILQTIQFRKPPLVAEGTKQELSHELEAVLVHREVTGSGYFANIIVPIEVSAEPSLDLLAPLLDSAELPQQVGEVSPVLVSSLPVKLAHIFANVSFQHFWGEVTTSCNSASAGARILMRNVTMATSKSRLQRILNLLKYVPDKPPTPPVQTWLVQPCRRGSTCSIPAATDLSPQLAEAQAAVTNGTTKLDAAKQAMDASLSALTGNETQISNDVYTTAIRNRDNLRNAQAAVDGATRTVDMLQAQISSAASAVWDSDAPAQTAQAAQAARAAQAVSSSSSNSSAATAGATAATNSTNATNSTTSGASAVLLASNSEVDGCNADLASPVDVDLSTAEHVDAGQIGDKASEALLFWRLAATPGLPSEAAAAESAAIVPKLRIENLGDRLRIRSEKPLMVFLAEGLELPVSFADISVPGQHSLAGKRAAAEVQLVHMPDDPSKAVAVSLQMDAGDTENSWFQHMGDALPRAGDATEVQGTDPMTMHPAFSRGVAGHFFRYKGRLLKDSRCARIRWHVLEERGHISNRQLAALREVLRPPGSSQMDPSALSPMLLRSQRKVSLASVRSHTQKASSPDSEQDAAYDRPSPSLKSLLLSLPRRSSRGQTLSP